MRRAALATAAAGVALLTAAGCGDDAQSTDEGRLVVSAAASLTEPVTACTKGFDGATVRLSFAGSDELAAQIRQGVRPDVFAAANTKLPDALHDEGLVEEPRVFATNELVVVVPNDSKLEAVEDLARDGTTVAVGDEDVPVGAYTKTVLDRLPAVEARAIRANVRTEEPDVKGVLGKVAQGAADAGFVYASDVQAAGERVRAIRLPDALKPRVEYGVAIVKGAPNPEAADRLVTSLVSGPCQAALLAAGFGPPA